MEPAPNHEAIWWAVGQIMASAIAAASAWSAHRQSKENSKKLLELSDTINTKLRIDRLERRLKIIEAKIDEWKRS